MRIGARESTRLVARGLDLPPLFRPVRLREAADAFAHAKAIAAEDGAGTLVWVGRFDIAEFAVVLEPEEPLAQARRAFYAGMTALLDALSAHAPPEKPISVDWPDAIRVDGGLVGGARLGWPHDASEDVAPQWLVFGAMVRLAWTDEADIAFGAALQEEGFREVGSEPLIESFARHLMAATDSWGEHGFGAITQSYLSRLAGASGETTLDGNGDLLVRRRGKRAVARKQLVPALAQPSWLDAQTGMPRKLG